MGKCVFQFYSAAATAVIAPHVHPRRAWRVPHPSGPCKKWGSGLFLADDPIWFDILDAGDVICFDNPVLRGRAEIVGQT